MEPVPVTPPVDPSEGTETALFVTLTSRSSAVTPPVDPSEGTETSDAGVIAIMRNNGYTTCRPV